jgi:hypothetical protein
MLSVGDVWRVSSWHFNAFLNESEEPSGTLGVPLQHSEVVVDWTCLSLWHLVWHRPLFQVEVCNEFGSLFIQWQLINFFVFLMGLGFEYSGKWNSKLKSALFETTVAVGKMVLAVLGQGGIWPLGWSFASLSRWKSSGIMWPWVDPHTGHLLKNWKVNFFIFPFTLTPNFPRKFSTWALSFCLWTGMVHLHSPK